ncbi:HlyD family efflux transporter periplasmic adaptor subunit [Neptunomonas qingdaonensis]|uniref:GAF domain-containing protein n=1 Tax=Neptunomonas qingdaonensis TaxID=1045558 RepID=A0A1I2M9B2_9GAMM|nr:HlyD family efflux transporter periplasmic adaptor subunit [Neptunomonas qingdaonensis]SFF87399.1 GAF domain-containing protein [Neptunomonas qingdaonensis]
MLDSNTDNLTSSETTSVNSQEIEHWLDWQCRMISDVNHGGIFLSTKNDISSLKPAALWPASGQTSSTLQSIAAKTIKGGAGIAQKEVSNNAEVFDYVAYPLFQKDRVIGAVVLALEIRSEAQRQAVLQLLQWGAIWAEKTLERYYSDRRRTPTLVLDAVAVCSKNEPLAITAHHLCNYLADNFDCSRVVLGFCKGLQVQILGMSHQLQFDRRIVRVSQIEFAMEECIEYGKPIIIPDNTSEQPGSIHIHAQQLLNSNKGSICSIPLSCDNTLIGVITLFSEKTNRFDNKVIDQLSTITQHLAPIFHLRQIKSQPGWKNSLHKIGTHGQRLTSAGNIGFKALTAICLTALLLITFLETDHLVTAQATVEGSMQQAVVAPFSSYIATANARAGDSVTKDQILATLDNRDLLLQQEKWLSEREKHSKEYQEALAIRDRAQVSALIARIAQTDAQLHHIDEQLQHTQLRAPFNGLLISGDWSRALGVPVERGQLLFEIVPAEGYRVALQVNDHDIAGIASEQQGRLRLAGLPEQPIQLSVSRIVPISSARQGDNHFRVEAEITDEQPGLRPGMQGVAKVNIGRASIIKVWTWSLLNRLRLWAWSLGL